MKNELEKKLQKKLTIKLPENLIKKLQELPETGMGYQVVNLKFANGNLIENVIILNSSILILDKNIKNIVVSQIEDIKLKDKVVENQAPRQKLLAKFQKRSI